MSARRWYSPTVFKLPRSQPDFFASLWLHGLPSCYCLCSSAMPNDATPIVSRFAAAVGDSDETVFITITVVDL